MEPSPLPQSARSTQSLVVQDFMLSYAVLASVLLLMQWSGTIHAQGDVSLWSSWVPVAVRSPYLAYWMNTTDVPYNATNVDGIVRAPTVWPLFMQGQNVGWVGMIRIDGDGNKTFTWLGNPAQLTGLHRSIVTNMQITPTRTIMNLTAGPLNLTVTFLSPIEPSNPALQSLPFTYLSLDITSNDGQAHAVQVYSDITGEWASGDRSNTIKWTSQTTDTIVYYSVSRQTPQQLSEILGQAEDATIFHATPIVPNQSTCTNIDTTCRSQFQQSGSLGSISAMVGPASISFPYPVFAMAVDLGTISSTSSPVMWAVGAVRDPAIGYTGFGGTEQYCRPYWSSQFKTAVDAVTYFIQDFADASDRATTLDQKILNDAATMSTHYTDLVSLAARQAMGGTELTIGMSGAGSINSNTSGVKMFMKDIVGETLGRVNAVEGLYAAFPFFLYLNATYGGYLLEPVLEFANTSSWTPAYPYAPRDIGANYPNATSTPESHDEGVEQSSNMLIMSLAHARATGDGSLINGYYPLLKLWATYLVNNSLPLTSDQLSIDSPSERNLTNLALKGIIGIKAMSEISAALHIDSDAHLQNVSTALAKQWQSQALSSASQHILASFGDPDTSWSLSYNLFADRLLNTTIVPSSVYQSETSFLKQLIASSSHGLSVDTNLQGQANTVWSLFAAAYVDDPSVAQGLVDQIWGFMSSNSSTSVGIFPTYYNNDTASSIGNINRPDSPLIGGIFAPLSLKVPSIAITVPADNSNSPPPAPSKKSNSVGAIVGGVVGGVSGAAAILLTGLWCYRKRRHTRELAEKDGSLYGEPAPFIYETAPFDLRVGPSAVNVSHMQPAYSKAREASLNTQGHSTLSPSVSAPGPTEATSGVLASNLSGPSETLPGLSSEASSGPASAGVTPLDVQGLRTEMQHLRQAMQSLREVQYEPPPGYESAAMDAP
ncbi:hypothetical protein NM688_g2626 [Phlebia brevispora]|uniref:Uncharacterized protein n=1 Tax=Phlebia brevispora TaxID=194682 RepID=A0ACC1T7V3_9APHY|nr:hypothetical protein NM688_g2626 [Phlebia brevispora]